MSLTAILIVPSLHAQSSGTISGVVHDRDDETPLAGVEVLNTNLDGDNKIVSSDQGSFVFRNVPPGKYTLVFRKSGYLEQLKEVAVTSGKIAEIEVWLSADVTELDEFVVQDVMQVGSGTEAALLDLRFESPALLDSISSELLSRAGASDAASALRLVSGASVQDGKRAVIRGLPDRYVSSQLNGVRLPSADEDTRSVELDQFPSAVIESIQVSKTFTPDQQGDASGGAVNVVLRGIPEEPLFFRFSAQHSYNSNVRGRTDFLSYDGGGVSTFGKDASDRPVQFENIGENWDGAVGVSERSAPAQFKWSLATGGSLEIARDLRVGAFANIFYERDASMFDDGRDDSYWIDDVNGPMVPRTFQGAPLPDADPPGNFGEFNTGLFDITQATESVQWGGLFTAGLEWKQQRIQTAFFQTHTTEDTATLAIDTRGKYYFFPGYDLWDPRHIGNSPDNRDAAPFLRNETLSYQERLIESWMFQGQHTAPWGDLEVADFWTFLPPELDWTIADSRANQNEPDKRQFGAKWWAPSFREGRPPFTEDEILPGEWRPLKPASNFTLGNMQRIFEEVDEQSDQYFVNLELPFRQWTDTRGAFRFGVFDDQVRRRFDQNTFSNFNDNSGFQSDWDERWSGEFPFGDHPVSDGSPFVDVDYYGQQDLEAWYAMVELPLFEQLKVIGGARVERLDIVTVNNPEADAKYVPKGATQLQDIFDENGNLKPDVNANFSSDDVLPAFAVVAEPTPELTFRVAYSETVARQTFKELTPIIQQEFLGGPIFVGNPLLELSNIRNYDLRVDYEPYEGSLISLSYFYKSIRKPIEYVQRIVSFDFTTPENFDSGRISGWEFELRQDLGQISEPLTGLSLGGNVTLIDSEVRLPVEERLPFLLPNINSPRSTRDATAAPEHLYNLYATYDVAVTGTQLGLFYSVTGDALVAGAGVSDGNLVPDTYALEYETLNLTLTQKIGEYLSLRLQGKNLTNPRIRTEYRPIIGSPRLRTSSTSGIDFSIALQLAFNF
ncbi:MAG: TonB-dependent receptor [Planctomycetota bacterium]